MRETERPRILWVNVRLLHPLNGGDRLRTYHMLRQMRRHARITYLCPRVPQDTDETVQKAAEYCDELITFDLDPPRGGTPRFYPAVLWNCLTSSQPFASRKYFSKQARDLISRELAGGKHDLVIADYLMSWIHFADLKPAPEVPTIVFQHNVESLIWQRHVANTANPLRRWICRREWQLTRAFEDHAARHATV